MFERYQATHNAAAQDAALPAPAEASTGRGAVAAMPQLADTLTETELSPRAIEARSRREFTYRLVALPVGLLVARLAVGTSMNGAASMLAMLLHESGHAITAWLTGRWAIPMLWVTEHGESRSWGVVFVVTASMAGFGALAWRAQRWGWVTIAGLALGIELMFQTIPVPAGALIVFGGDGGALVLGTILIAAFYAPSESWLRKNPGLRWGLLAIGALAFMSVYRLWSGPLEALPFGEIEGVNLSDPSILTEMYGWSVLQLVDRYLLLAHFCFAAMAIAYLWGLISGYADLVVESSRAAGAVSS